MQAIQSRSNSVHLCIRLFLVMKEFIQGNQASDHRVVRNYSVV